MNDNRPLTYLRRLIKKVDLIKSDVGNIKLDTTPITNAISSLTDNFNTWKAPWTSVRAEKIDTVTANSETIKSTMAKDATVAKQSVLNTVNTNVNTLVKNMGAVKSVQRGYSRETDTINFNPINLNKTIFIIICGNGTFGMTIVNNTDRSFTVKNDSNHTKNYIPHFYWQVVEFY